MREALEVRDYTSLEDIVAEALVLWHEKRKRELEALAALSREIETALSGTMPDLKRIAELRAKGRALLGASEELRWSALQQRPASGRLCFSCSGPPRPGGQAKRPARPPSRERGH